MLSSINLGHQVVYGDILRNIFSYLSFPDLPSAAKTCRFFRSQVNDELMSYFLHWHSDRDFQFLKRKISHFNNEQLLYFLESKKSPNLAKLVFIVKAASEWIFSGDHSLIGYKYHLFDYLKKAKDKLQLINNIRLHLLDFSCRFSNSSLEPGLKYVIFAKEYLDDYDRKMVNLFKSRILVSIIKSINQFDGLPLDSVITAVRMEGNEGFSNLDRTESMINSLKKKLAPQFYEQRYSVDCFFEDLRYENLNALESSTNSKNPYSKLFRAFLCNPRSEMEKIRKILDEIQTDLPALSFSLLGFKEMKSGNIEEARRAFKRAVELGDVKILFKFGRQNISRNEGKIGSDYMWKAARSGYSRAEIAMGKLLIEHGDEELRALGVKTLKNYGNEREVSFALGSLYLEDPNLCKREAVYWLTRSAGDENIQAIHLLGFLYAFGYHVDKDEKKAVLLFKQARLNGHLGSKVLLSVLAKRFNEFFDPSEEELIRRDPFLYGLARQFGICFQKDEASALRLFKESQKHCVFSKMHLENWKAECLKSLNEFNYPSDSSDHLEKIELGLKILERAIFFELDAHSIKTVYDQCFHLAVSYRFKDSIEQLSCFLKFRNFFKGVNEIYLMKKRFSIDGIKSASKMYPSYYNILFQTFSVKGKIVNNFEDIDELLLLEGIPLHVFHKLIKFITGETMCSNSSLDDLKQMIDLAERLGVTVMVVSEGLSSLLKVELFDPLISISDFKQLMAYSGNC